jgi:hypothetical protein
MVAPQPDSGWGRQSFTSLFTDSCPSSHIKLLSTHNGEPALLFSKEQSLPFKYALIGKFQQGRPPVDKLCKDFQTIDLKRRVQRFAFWIITTFSFDHC